MNGQSQSKRNGQAFGSADGDFHEPPKMGKDNMFASLTAGLLARKGEASPASAHLDGVSIHSHGVDLEPLEELAGEPAPAPAQESSPAPVAELRAYQPKPPKTPDPEEQRRRASARASEAVAGCCDLDLPKAVVEHMPEGPRSTVTTRLDPERVRKLKILAARMGTSNQKVMLAALDHYLEYACEVLAAECPCLARSINGDKLDLKGL